MAKLVSHSLPLLCAVDRGLRLDVVKVLRGRLVAHARLLRHFSMELFQALGDVMVHCHLANADRLAPGPQHRLQIFIHGMLAILHSEHHERAGRFIAPWHACLQFGSSDDLNG